MADSRLLRDEFARRWRLNQTGGFRARLSRWRVIPGLVEQRLGRQRWVKGRVFWGDPIYLLTGETVSRGILGFGYTEAALTALMLSTLKPEMTFVDVGAHLGYVAMLASVLVGADGRVVSFEPQAQISEWTRRNLTPYPRARFVASAVGEQNGTLSFLERSAPESALSGQFEAVESTLVRRYDVSVVTLDDALNDERPVDFIKCDVEGAEVSVLRGCTDILKVDRPLLVLEAEMPDESNLRPRVAEFIDLLAPLGYEPLMFEFDGTLRLGPPGAFSVGHANVAFVHPSRLEFSDLRTAVACARSSDGR
jgi:FkbM family methyltransferase